jgi:hypothetical protein
VALGPESIAAIHRFRDGLFQTLLAGTCGSSAGRDSGASADVEEAADRVLAQMRPRRLAQVAKRLELELARAKADLSTDIGVLRGASFWPLIPAAYVSADGSRRIVALTSRKALCVHGTALKICLAYERLDWYARQCRRAASFVLGVLDATSGAPRSTMHISRSAWNLPETRSQCAEATRRTACEARLLGYTRAPIETPFSGTTSWLGSSA